MTTCIIWNTENEHDPSELTLDTVPENTTYYPLKRRLNRHTLPKTVLLYGELR